MKNYFKQHLACSIVTFSIALFVLACGSNKQEEKGEAAGVAENNPPYWDDIQNFRKRDSVSFPQDSAILFIGSSSFTLWQHVQDDFPGYTIINRGFGGSTLLDQIRYANDIIFPYNPKQIIIYCGENDFAWDSTVIVAMVFARFKELFQMIRQKLADIPIAYISMKPSPSRRHLVSKMLEANQNIKDYLGSQKNTVFIDVHSKMLNEANQPMPEIFLDDSLHMNEKGYAIWQKAIQPYLIK
jgi:lysophospholipase L1-like esterase